MRAYPKRPFHLGDKTYITAEGYKRLRQLTERQTKSNQCFVAMWFSDEMNDAIAQRGRVMKW